MKRMLLGLAGAVALGRGCDERGSCGKTLPGDLRWQVTRWLEVEHREPGSWKLVDGASGGQWRTQPHVLCRLGQAVQELRAEVDCKCAPNSNGGIYIRTKYQETGWPKYGHESQVNNSYVKDPKKSGSLYGIVDVTEQHIPDDTWWDRDRHCRWQPHHDQAE